MLSRLLTRTVASASARVIRDAVSSCARTVPLVGIPSRTPLPLSLSRRHTRLMHSTARMQQQTQQPYTTVKQTCTQTAAQTADPTLPTHLQSLAASGQFPEAELYLSSSIAQLSPRGGADHVQQLKRLSTIYMMQSKNQEAEKVLREALQYQQKIFEQNTNAETFLSSIGLLSHLLTCIRLSGINPANHSNLDSLLTIYEQGIRAPFATRHIEQFKQASETPAVYSFLCYLVSSYTDAENFNKAKKIVQQHLLFDLATTTPSSVSGSYDLRDLRLASGLNFMGLILWNDHSACAKPGAHAQHHHEHDASAAKKTWNMGLEYTKPFVELVKTNKPVGQLDETDILLLQAHTMLLDNLSQVCMSEGEFDEACSHSAAIVSVLQCSLPRLHHELIVAQIQLLKTYLETTHMDEAEAVCEELLASFPGHHRLSTVQSGASEKELEEILPLPSTITLDTSLIFDELSQVMFQYKNLDYSERFLQLSLHIQRCRLRDMEGKPITLHPQLAKTYNALGLVQSQMKDYVNAERNLAKGLQIKLALSAADPSSSPSSSSSSPDSSDHSAAEFYHNLGLAQIGVGRAEKLLDAERNLLAAKAQYDVRYFNKESGSVNKLQANYAGLCSQLGQLYKLLKKDKQALEYSLEALEIKKQIFSPTSKELVNDLYLTAFLYATSFGDYSNAIPLYKQMINIVDKPSGGRPPNALSLGVALHWLAQAHDKLGETVLAADNWRKCLGQLEKCAAPAEILPVQRELARVLQQIGMEQEREELMDKIKANEIAAEKLKREGKTESEEGAQFLQ